MRDQVAEMGFAHSWSVAASAVPDWYEQTGIGKIPEDWDVLPTLR